MLSILVPVKGSSIELSVLPKSAIVCRTESLGRELAICYYEGNLFESDSLSDFRSRLDCAAGRLIDTYPTVAMMGVSSRDVIEVGTYDEVRRFPSSITNEAAILAWSGEAPVDIIGEVAPKDLGWYEAVRIATAPHSKVIGQFGQYPAGWVLTAARQVLKFNHDTKKVSVYQVGDPELSLQRGASLLPKILQEIIL
jgi:hypothetical protein